MSSNLNITPDDPNRLPPARRRRARRLLTPLGAQEQGEFYEQLARKASPSLGFFFFSILGGLLIGLGILLDQPYLLVFGAVASPLMTPVIGLSLGTSLGAFRYFLRSLIGLAIGLAFVFGLGVVAGLLQTFLPEPWPEFFQAFFHARLIAVNFIVVLLGTVVMVIALIRDERSARLPSVVVAYGLNVPLAVAGFGLSSGVPYLWPDALLVFALNLVGAVIIGAVVLVFFGYRPPTLFGYSLGSALVLLVFFFVIGFGGINLALQNRIALPTLTPSVTPTPVPPTLTPTQTVTPVPPTPTNTLTITPTPTVTVTPSPVPPTPTPTPVFAIVNVPGFDGARIRVVPQGNTITVIDNGTLVQVIPEDTTEIDGVVWLHIIGPENIDGWMVGILLATATPGP